MPRRLRLQFEDACYHVLNRGNYRQPVFASVGAAQAFEAALSEACELHEWRLHAYTVMTNHYHLALETPRANLAMGMHWLQSTFGTRFNRLRNERGHLFQGRYQALLIGDDSHLVRVIDYIHLNPVRAGIVAPSQVAAFRWSSLRRLMRTPRPAWLVTDRIRAQFGLQDNEEDWARYVARLVALGRDPAEQRLLGFDEFDRGWAIGTWAWRRAVAAEYANPKRYREVPADESRDFKESIWRRELAAALGLMGKNAADVARDPKSAGWKIEAARRLRAMGAPYAWIATALNMGRPSSARVFVSRAINK